MPSLGRHKSTKDEDKKSMVSKGKNDFFASSKKPLDFAAPEREDNIVIKNLNKLCTMTPEGYLLSIDQKMFDNRDNYHSPVVNFGQSFGKSMVGG